MQLRIVTLGTLICLNLIGCSASSIPSQPTTQPVAARDPRIGDVDPVLPSEKVERALNGTFNFPPSPQVAWTADDRGFDKDRLFHAPAPGVHPRILFGPEDLPRIRQNLAANEAGKGEVAALQAMVDKGIGTSGTWESQCFEALSRNDLDGFRAAFKESPLDNQPPGSGFHFDIPGRTPATRWGPRNPLLACIEVKAFLALIDGDAVAGKQVATALAAYAAYISPKVDAANALPRHEFHWTSTRDLVPQEIAYAYDWAWPWMNAQQRDAVRSVIVRATAGKYTLGMDLPQHWRNWNHIGITESYTACMFAIEGEPGDDPRGRDRIFEVYRDYLSYGIDNLGSGTEGIGYQTAGIGHLSGALIAFANRGKNLMLHPHWRLQTESWLVQTMQPFGGAWQSNSDLANFPPALSMLGVQKYFYPESPGIDFVLRNHPLIQKKDWARIAVEGCEAQWIMPTVPGETDTRHSAQQAAQAIAGGLTFHDPQRGILYTRTGWRTDDLALHVDCRVDTTFPTHDHPDRGQFTLSALGRAWACAGHRDTESKFLNVVTIDGRGQGYFPPPGAWVDAIDNARETTAIVDAKYCWDWRWIKSCFTESPESLRRRNQSSFTEAAVRNLQRVPLDQWEVDPLPIVTAYYQGFADRAHGDPRMWDDEDGWQLRSKWYPVRKAFRTVTLARGAHPYVLVIDDIRKDDAEHLYEWRMNAPPDVAAVSISAGDILLGDETTHRAPVDLQNAFQGKTPLVPEKGDRLLLVRTLDIAVPDLPTLQPIPMVAAIEFKKTDDTHQFTGRSNGMGTQIVIGSRSVEPRFAILLYPHRMGDVLPQTTWNADHTHLTIAFPDQQDDYAISQTPDGRRVLRRMPGRL